MLKVLRKLRALKKSLIDHRPLIEVLIYKDRLIANFNEYKKTYPQLQLAPVLKSNAYGHGLVEVAEILDRQQNAFFVVDSLFEARALRHNQIKSKILVIGYTSAENINSCRLQDLAFTLTSLEQLREIAEQLRWGMRLHIKIDTGMHRQGILPEEIEQAVALIKSNKLIELEGVCSHFADADNSDQEFSKKQIAVWQQVVQKFKQEFQTIKYWHLANTAGTYYSDQVDCNVARLGGGLYGYGKSPFVKLNLKPTLQMQSIISSIRPVRAGEFVGYNLEYQAEHEIRAATIPVGYFEGMDRRLSNRGIVQVSGCDCPVIGLVSMNITSIDVSAVPEAKLGDAVVVISSDPVAPNSAENIAKLTGANPREILVHIPQHLRRTVI